MQDQTKLCFAYEMKEIKMSTQHIKPFEAVSAGSHKSGNTVGTLDVFAVSEICQFSHRPCFHSYIGIHSELISQDGTYGPAFEITGCKNDDGDMKTSMTEINLSETPDIRTAISEAKERCATRARPFDFS